jgi:putative flippase GtrA
MKRRSPRIGNPPAAPLQAAPGLKHQMFWFGIVGVIGFVVDGGVLEGMVHGFGSDPYSARALSFLAAASSTWLLNRRLTFSRSDRASVGEWGLYVLLMMIGALLNLGVYAAVVWRFGSSEELLLIALAAGTGAGMVVNFSSARYLLHRPSPDLNGGAVELVVIAASSNEGQIASTEL